MHMVEHWLVTSFYTPFGVTLFGTLPHLAAL